MGSQCVQCVVFEVSLGGANAECTTCKDGQIPNADQSACEDKRECADCVAAWPGYRSDKPAAAYLRFIQLQALAAWLRFLYLPFRPPGGMHTTHLHSTHAHGTWSRQ